MIEKLAGILEGLPPKVDVALPPRGEERLALHVLNGERSRPVQLTVEVNGDVVSVSSELLGIGGLGPSYFEAVEDLADQVDMLARHYLSVPEEKLTQSGLRLKRALAEILAT